MPNEDSLVRLHQLMQSLAAISEAADSVADLLRRVVRETMRVTGATGAVVEQVDGDELVYVCVDGSVAPHLGLRLPRGGSLSGAATSARQAVRCDDSEDDPRVNREACRMIRARSMLIVPLCYGGEVVGVIKATSEQPAAFAALDQQLLELAAGLIAGALGRQQQHEAAAGERRQLQQALDQSRDAERRARHASLVDALTGLPNRRQFEQWIEALLAHPVESAALLFLDLNGFKGINDRFGHEVGDAALRRLADLLRSTVPENYRVARLAGDEFVVLAAGLGRDPAAQVGWTCRKLLAALEPPQPLDTGLLLPLSVSIGAALHDPALGRGDWLARADAAMYAAKAGGRNQLRWHCDAAPGVARR